MRSPPLHPLRPKRTLTQGDARPGSLTDARPASLASGHVGLFLAGVRRSA